MPVAAERPGALIDGRFRLERRLGAGREGAVWLAWDEQRAREVALKLLRAGKHPSSHDLREVNALEALRHPNVARLREVVRNGDRSVLVLDHVAGETLDRALYVRSAARRPFDAAALRSIFTQICAGVGAAHGLGIVHRDLKPANLILGEEDGDLAVKVVDFGLARILGRTGDEQTTQGRVFGSYAYMAPEQARGEPVTPASDVFALGAILFEIATLHRAWEHDPSGALLRCDDDKTNTPVELTARMASAPPPSVGAFRDDLPEALDAVLRAAMAADPKARPLTALQLQRAVEEALPEPPGAGEGEVRPAEVQPVQRGTGWWWAGGGLALLLALLVVGIAPGSSREDAPSDSPSPDRPEPSIRALPAPPEDGEPAPTAGEGRVEPAPPVDDPERSDSPVPAETERAPRRAARSPSRPERAARRRARADRKRRRADRTLRRLFTAAKQDPNDGAALQALVRAMTERAASLSDGAASRRFQRLIESSALVADLDELEQILGDIERAHVAGDAP